MEASILAEENQGRDSALASNTKRSTIKIDSIHIDLSNANEKAEAKNCEHFSIRGYVAEIRKKDRKICCPFSLDDNGEEQCMLPPLHVAKFKWWRCQNCQREIGAEGDAKENGMVPNHCNIGFKSNSTCSHMPSHGGLGMLLSDCQQALKRDIVEGRKAAANASTNVHSKKCYLSLYGDKKEDKVQVTKASIIAGHQNGFPDDVNNEIPRPTCEAKEVNPCLMREIRTDVTAIQSQCNGFVEFCKADCGGREATDTRLASRNLKCMIEGSAKICQTEKHGQHRETACTSEVVGVVDQAFDAAKVHASRHPSLEINECGYVSSESESDAILIRTNQHHDNSSGLLCKKTRRVRLLAELLDANRNTRTDHIMTEDAPSNAVPDSATRVGSLSVPQGNVARGVRHQYNKRKMSLDEDWRPPEVSCLNNVKKRVRFFNGDAESADTNNAIVSSELEESAPARIGLPTGIKSHGAKCRIGRNTIKKYKTQVGDGHSSLVHSADVVPRNNHDKIGDADKGNNDDGVLFKSAQDVFNGRGVDHSFESYLPAQHTERESSLRKKKKKMPQVEDGQASLMPWNNEMLSKGPITGKDVKIIQVRPEIVPCQSAQDELHREERLRLSIQDYMAAQRNDRNYISQVEDGLDSLLLQQQSISREHQIMRKNINCKNIGDSSVSFTSAPDAFLGRQECGDLSTKNTANRMSFVSGKQNCTPQAKGGAFPLMQHKDFSGIYGNCRPVGAQEHSDITKKPVGAQKHSDISRSDQRDKVLEQAALDDIPMEIVELMAKNQYERCLHDDKNSYCLLETSNKTRNTEMIDFAEVRGNGALRLLPEENPHLRKIQSTSARNGIITKDEMMQPIKQKSVSFFSHNRNHFNMGQLEETHASRVFIPFSQYQEKQSTGVQFSATVSNGHRSVQNCRFNGDTAGQRFSHNSLQASEAHDTCQNVSQKSDEAAAVWPSILSNDMCFGPNIPQKCPTQSSDIHLLSQCPGALHKGKMHQDHDVDILNLNAANPEKQNRNFSSETFNRTPAGYQFSFKQKGSELHPKLMGSLDLYSNETIPAMHLLSLMDAGLQSNTAFNMDGNQKLLKKPSFPHNHYCKEFSGLGYGVYKTGDTSRCPSSKFYSKNHLSEKSCECFPAVPSVCSFASFQSTRNFEGNVGLAAQNSLKSSREGKTGSYSSTQKRGRRPRKSGLTSCGLGSNHESGPVHDTQKRFFGASDSMEFPFQYHTADILTKRIELQGHGNSRTVLPMESISETETCGVNRNPADFSVPEAGNVYMIGGDGLKVGKTVPSGERSGLVNLDGLKRQRTMKLAAIK